MPSSTADLIQFPQNTDSFMRSPNPLGAAIGNRLSGRSRVGSASQRGSAPPGRVRHVPDAMRPTIRAVARVTAARPEGASIADSESEPYHHTGPLVWVHPGGSLIVNPCGLLVRAHTARFCRFDGIRSTTQQGEGARIAGLVAYTRNIAGASRESVPALSPNAMRTARIIVIC
jgi:hypothetical protein